MEPEVEVLPPLDRGAAEAALCLVDNLVKKQHELVDEADKSGMVLARLIAEVSGKGYWMVRGFDNEKDYIAEVFKGSRSQYYILKRIGDKLGKYPIKLLESIGMSKCQDLVRIHDHYNGTIPDNWFILAQEESRDSLREKVRACVGRALLTTGDQNLYVNLKFPPEMQPAWRRATEMLMREAVSDKSISYIAYLLCVEFLSGHNEEGYRLDGMYGLTIDLIYVLMKSLKGCPDPTMPDRLIGKIREALEELKD
jgi:hypothetical protein